MPNTTTEHKASFDTNDSFDDCECPRCRGELTLSRMPDPREIVRDGVVCAGCGAGFDIIWGSPFLGHFESDDILGLVEIAANARDKPQADAPSMRRLEALLSAYHRAADRKAFIEATTDDFVRASWFGNRYTEWHQFAELTTGLSFAGLKVLDVGAGAGFDSFRLFAAGAQVTALEYNPVLVQVGMKALPNVRWIGGFAHVLPFASETFDAVCCNAALHHMRDVSQALEEMLRVLKPGGWLITTGDPYRARGSGVDAEFAVFNCHPGALLGINESIPSFTAFESVLSRHREKMSIQLLTTELYGAQLPGRRTLLDFLRRRLPAAKRTFVRDLHHWEFDTHRQMLGDANGGIGILCRVEGALHIPSRRQENVVISAGDFAATLADYPAAVQRLVPLLPSYQINRPFPGSEQTKFELLNGWQAPDRSDARTAYKRARWFLGRPSKAESLCFETRQVEPLSGVPAHCEVFINGHLARSVALNSTDWSSCKVPLKSLAPGEVFVCELRLVFPVGVASPTFEQELFQVRHRQYE